MKHILLFLSLIGWLSLPVCAQNALVSVAAKAEKSAVTPAGNITGASTTHADTVAAVHFLFRAMRREADEVTIVGLSAAAAFVFLAVGLQNWGRSEKDYTAPTILGAAIIGGGPALLASGKRRRFSEQQERTVIDAYNQGGALPANITSRLRKHYFAK
ncbi:hypothetical protein Q3A66_02040 [Hymenobacter sp. BT770]|uniref:hypothetical protein n=1 Tax=Hymenobacter sp. BT770 TaxID=2886942 RepID=UPI001D116A53|nr:hypothetical protein [Hymenobacter sp. BT770]MCC3151591.1 hypothetical protein [Hymenobacter sp. BT770]MDO3413832.1 hypothetical protein [Hymenobacter sp. BT770]